MICRNCGGQIPDGSKVCGFCETEVCGPSSGEAGEAVQLEKRMEEILKEAGCSGCPGCGSSEGAWKSSEGKEAHWWKEGDCASCGGGLTGTDKDLKYALTIVGLMVGVVVFALIVKNLFGF